MICQSALSHREFYNLLCKFLDLTPMYFFLFLQQLDSANKEILSQLEQIRQRQEQIRQRQEQLLSIQLQQHPEPSTPAAATYSYADFIAANVEDISPYVPDEKTTVFDAATVHREEVFSSKQRSSVDKTDATIPIQEHSADQVVPARVTTASSLAHQSQRCCLLSSPVPLCSPKPVMSGLSQLMQRTPDAAMNLPQRNEVASTMTSNLLDISYTPPDAPCGQISTSSMNTTTLTFSTPSSPCPHGSLSLAAHLTSRPPAVAVPNLHKFTTVAQTVARFHDALLDDEVALYACRVAHKHGIGKCRSSDPVASVLSEADDLVSVKCYCAA